MTRPPYDLERRISHGNRAPHASVREVTSALGCRMPEIGSVGCIAACCGHVGCCRFPNKHATALCHRHPVIEDYDPPEAGAGAMSTKCCSPADRYTQNRHPAQDFMRCCGASTISHHFGRSRACGNFRPRRRSIHRIQNGGAHHDSGYEPGYLHPVARHHQPDRDRLGHCRACSDCSARAGRRGMTALFLLTTILTSATGFLFPFTQLLPSHMIGILSLVLLAIACVRAVRHEACRRVALDLCGDRDGLALPQRLRAGDPELPQGARRCTRWRRACRRPSRRSPSCRARAGVLHPRHHRRGETVSPAGGDSMRLLPA